MPPSVLFTTHFEYLKESSQWVKRWVSYKAKLSKKLCFDKNDERLNTQFNSIAIYPLIKLTLILPDF